MKPEHQAWITAYAEREKDVALKCAVATLEMVATFPELTRHRGFVWCGQGIDRTHWWCKDGDMIVDPTMRQFDQWGGVAFYDEHVPGPDGEPTGKCLHCGELVYHFATFCNATCAAEDRRIVEKLTRKDPT